MLARMMYKYFGLFKTMWVMRLLLLRRTITVTTIPFSFYLCYSRSLQKLGRCLNSNCRKIYLNIILPEKWLNFYFGFNSQMQRFVINDLNCQWVPFSLILSHRFEIFFYQPRLFQLLFIDNLWTSTKNCLKIIWFRFLPAEKLKNNNY